MVANKKLKRWFPFIFMIGIALISFLYLVLFPEEKYKPHTDDPDLIYYQACSECHGDYGQGRGVLNPALNKTNYSKKDIEDYIVAGSWRMPKFKYIHGDTLKKLVNYIHAKGFLDDK